MGLLIVPGRGNPSGRIPDGCSGSFLTIGNDGGVKIRDHFLKPAGSWVFGQVLGYSMEEVAGSRYVYYSHNRHTVAVAKTGQLPSITTELFKRLILQHIS